MLSLSGYIAFVGVQILGGWWLINYFNLDMLEIQKTKNDEEFQEYVESKISEKGDLLLYKGKKLLNDLYRFNLIPETLQVLLDSRFQFCLDAKIVANLDELNFDLEIPNNDSQDMKNAARAWKNFINEYKKFILAAKLLS